VPFVPIVFPENKALANADGQFKGARPTALSQPAARSAMPRQPHSLRSPGTSASAHAQAEIKKAWKSDRADGSRKIGFFARTLYHHFSPRRIGPPTVTDDGIETLGSEKKRFLGEHLEMRPDDAAAVSARRMRNQG
jgi:hypothetical protein